jgi:hypothetical protein
VCQVLGFGSGSGFWVAVGVCRGASGCGVGWYLVALVGAVGVFFRDGDLLRLSARSGAGHPCATRLGGGGMKSYGHSTKGSIRLWRPDPKLAGWS